MDNVSQAQVITAILLVATLTIFSLADLYLAWQHGSQGTVSAVIREASHRWPLLPFLAGVLADHLFWS